VCVWWWWWCFFWNRQQFLCCSIEKRSAVRENTLLVRNKHWQFVTSSPNTCTDKWARVLPACWLVSHINRAAQAYHSHPRVVRRLAAVCARFYAHWACITPFGRRSAPYDGPNLGCCCDQSCWMSVQTLCLCWQFASSPLSRIQTKRATLKWMVFPMHHRSNLRASEVGSECTTGENN
jgi:hypothetical protein